MGFDTVGMGIVLMLTLPVVYFQSPSVSAVSRFNFSDCELPGFFFFFFLQLLDLPRRTVPLSYSPSLCHSSLSSLFGWFCFLELPIQAGEGADSKIQVLEKKTRHENKQSKRRERAESKALLSYSAVNSLFEAHAPH